MRIKEIANIRIGVKEGQAFTLGELINEDWVSLEAKSLSNIKRYGGFFDSALSVARHAVLVSELVHYWGEDAATCYAALHHEIEEAFGIGDIIHDVKYYIFSDSKEKYNNYKKYLVKLFNLGNIDKKIVKKADVVVGMLEAEYIGLDGVMFSHCKYEFPTLDKDIEEARKLLHKMLLPLNSHADRELFVYKHKQLLKRMN